MARATTRRTKALQAGGAATARVDRPKNIGNPRMGWGSDVAAEVTRRLGFKYIALVPGASYRGFHDSIVNYLGNDDPQMVICLHEEHCVSIAEGYAKVTEEPMAVALHSNVGLMHAAMPIFDAWCARLPVVIFGATGPVDANLRRPWIDWIHTAKDQGAMIRDFIKWDDEPRSPEATVEAILRANQIARTPPFGPVYVCLDAGLQEMPLDGEVAIPDPARFAPPPPPMPPADQVRRIVAALKKARAPVILAGRVSRDPKDWDRRVRLAEALGAAVLTDLHNASAFPTTHPLHLAAPCHRPTPDVRALVQQADAILSLDWLDLAGFLRATLGASQTQKPTDAVVAHCSLDATIANGWSMDHQALPAVDLPVLARPDDLVAAMLDEMGKDGGRKTARPAFRKITHWTKSAAGKAKPRKGGPMAPVDFALTLRDFAAGRKVTFTRTSLGWPGEASRFEDPLAYLGVDAGGAVGSGPGHTIGSALALKDSGRLPIGVIGDGDYLMGVNALWTASRLRIPLMIVIANNRSYFNDEAHQERVAVARGRPVENRWIGQRIDDPAVDLVALARAQGFEAEGPVETTEALTAALARGAEIVAKGGRFLIDARVQPGYADTTPDRATAKKG